MVLKVDETVSGFRVGDRFDYQFTVTDTLNAPMHDAGINVEIVDPLSVALNRVLSDPELTHVPTGTYDYYLLLTLEGDYYVEFRLTSGQSYLIYLPVSGKLNP